MVMHSAKIEVKVLPPIPTSDWTVTNLDQHIAGVRQQYVDTSPAGDRLDGLLANGGR